MMVPLQYSCLENPMDVVGYSPQGRKESDMTEKLHFQEIMMLIFSGHCDFSQVKYYTMPKIL